VRRAVITSAATVSGVVLLLSLKPHHETTTTASPITSGGSGADATGSGGTSGTSGTSGSAGAGDPTGSAGTTSNSSAARTLTGDAADTRFGPVQVKITVKAKKITDISVLQYPSDNSRDQEINSYALPLLNQEALNAQSAEIDAVSGATFTSDGYTRSLQSAIDKAGL
jgi:uncharacterized protein with FMN-binding domain